MSARRSAFSDRPGPDTHPDHHLWRNGRRWWVAFTFHTLDGRKVRVRRSLGTTDVDAARLRRDELLREFESAPGPRLSLRFASLSTFELPLFESA